MSSPSYQIAELPCRNGWLGIAPMPGRKNAYEFDLSSILRWQANLVLTMTTQHEFKRAGAEAMASDLEACGVGWRHLPIPDFGAPPPEVAALWPEVSAEAHALLEQGRRVLAHCFGGCGRSGMALLRLMVEAGEDADPALARLRDARPCAVETEAQKAWASIPMFERCGWSR